MVGVWYVDIDLVMFYDVFIINILLFFEDLGFCVKGEGGLFVQGGCIVFGGELVVNINGGGLFCVYLGMYGMFLIIEVVIQFCCQGGEWQLVKVDVVLLYGNGGMLFSQVIVLFGIGDMFQIFG